MLLGYIHGTQTVTTAPTTSSTPSTPSTPSQPEEQAVEIDPDYWVQYAIDYATDKGLELDESTNGSWDTPIAITENTISNGRLKEGIEADIDWYIEHEGITAVWIWAEKPDWQTDDNWYLFIGRG